MTDKACFPSVIFRKYVFQIAISLFCLVFLTVLSLAVCQKATESYAERERFKEADLNVVFFSKIADGEEAFYSFNGNAKVFGGGHRMNTDVLMTLGGMDYKENPLYLKNKLPDGGCAVSENLAHSFGVEKGDVLTVIAGAEEKRFDFTVSEILPAQSGIDGKYMHEGIVILSENKELVGAAGHVFVSFAKDKEEYTDLVDDTSRGASVVFTQKLIKSMESRLLIYMLISFACLWAFIALCETVIFSRIGRKYRDYLVLSGYGIGRMRLFGSVFADNAIKYLMPLTVSFLIWLLNLRIYRMAYLVPALTFLAFGVCTVTVLTFITVMRKQGCPKIKR